MSCTCIQGMRATTHRSFKTLHVATCLIAAGFALPAQAVNFTWFGGDGDWGSSANWRPTIPSGPPGSTDTAVIGTGTVALSSATFVGSLVMQGGRLRATANLVVNETMTFSGGSLESGGGTVIANGGLVISGTETKNLGYLGGLAPGGLINNSEGIWVGTGNLQNGNINGLLRNGAAGTFDIRTDADFLNGTLDNRGTLMKSVGLLNDKTQVTGYLLNSGSIEVRQGNLSFAGGGAHSGSFMTASDAWLEFANGYNGNHDFNSGARLFGNLRFTSGSGMLNFNAGSVYDVRATEVTEHAFVSFNDATVQSRTDSLMVSGGSISGTGSLAVNGRMTWTGGQIGGESGNVISSGELLISGSDTKSLGYLGGLSLSGVVNNGNAVWTGAGNLHNGTVNGLFRNNLTGTFDIRTDADFLNGTLDNRGTLIKSVGSLGDKTLVTGYVVNSGLIEVRQGILALAGGGMHTGSFTSTSDAWLEFANGYNGNHEFNRGSRVSGNLRFTSGSDVLNFNAGSVYDARSTEITDHAYVSLNDAAAQSRSGTLSASGGQLKGVGTLIVSGATIFTAGAIGGDGGNVVTNGGLTISGSETKSLGYLGGPASSGILNNGAAVWTGTGNLQNGSPNGLFRNSPTGSLDIRTDADFLNGTLDNRGTLIKSIGSLNDMTQVTGTLLNTGSLRVQQGTLQVTTPFTNQGALTVTGGALFRSTNAQFANAAQAALRGNGTIQTALNQALTNQGAISPGESIGRLTIDGSLIAGSTATLNIELANLASFDQLSVTKNVTLGGALSIWNLGYAPALGDSFIVMTFDQRQGASTFQTLNWYGFGADTQFAVSYHDHDVTLTVTAAVPEPHTWLLLVAGIGVLGSLTRRRSQH